METERPYHVPDIKDTSALKKHIRDYHEMPITNGDKVRLERFHERLHDEEEPIMVPHEHQVFPPLPTVKTLIQRLLASG